MRTDWLELKYCVKQPGNQALADLPARIGIPITDEVENTKEEQCQALQFFRRPVRPRPYKLYSFTYIASLSHTILHLTYIPSFAVNARVARSPNKNDVFVLKTRTSTLCDTHIKILTKRYPKYDLVGSYYVKRMCKM